MRRDGKREVQHYVPKMLLRGFAQNQGGDNWQIGVFDKLASRRFSTNIRNVAAESGFYEGSIDNQEFSGEELFSKIEGKATPVFERIKAQNSLSALSQDERSHLALFVATQFLRSKTAREQLKEFNTHIGDHIRRMGHDPAQAEGFKAFESDDEIKLHSLTFLGKTAVDISKLLLGKNLSLFITSEKLPFWVGDNPVTLHNNNDFRPYGNLGFGVRGIEIYLPISSTQVLGMLCPSILAEHQDTYKKGKSTLANLSVLSVLNMSQNPMVLGQQRRLAEEALARIEQAIKDFTSDRPLECTSDNVDFFNALQARSAERFIMAKSTTFDDVEKMLANTEVARKGPRWKMN